VVTRLPCIIIDRRGLGKQRRLALLDSAVAISAGTNNYCPIFDTFTSLWTGQDVSDERAVTLTSRRLPD